jgi:hypothetical protein
MKHTYELRKLEKDDSLKTVLKITAEPKDAKRRAEEYATRNPGLYSLQKIEEVKHFFTETNVDKTEKE